MLTCPMKFNNKIDYKKPMQFINTMDGAVELISETLKINPIVSRILNFDMKIHTII